MSTIQRWQDLEKWSPPLIPGGEFRRQRFTALLSRFEQTFGGSPTAVKVTGTSGKGSVCAILEAALIADGAAVGVFTSPHLTSPTERIRIGGHDISEVELNTAVIELAPFFDAIVATMGEAFRPTFFEALLFVALRLFARRHVNIAIWEVAVGGRNDPVGLLKGPLSVITSVGLDHVVELGPSLSDIAAHKAGVATPGSILVVGPAIDDTASSAIAAEAARRGVQVEKAAPQSTSAKSLGADGHSVHMQTVDGEVACLFPLPGEFQLSNLACVVASIHVLRRLGLVASTKCLGGIEAVRWPGRLEFLRGNPTWIIDCAHNELAFKALAAFVQRNLSRNDTTLVFGASEPEKVVCGLRLLGPLVRQVLFVEGFHRSVEMPPAIMTTAELAGVDILQCESPAKAVATVMESTGSSGRTVLATGSVFLAGACRGLLIQHGYTAAENRP